MFFPQRFRHLNQVFTLVRVLLFRGFVFLGELFEIVKKCISNEKNWIHRTGDHG